MTLYSDAGTRNNGRVGEQESVVVLHDGDGVVLEKNIGDYTNNEAELTGIALAIKQNADVIYSDSKTAIAWATKGWTKYRQKQLNKGKMTERHKTMITTANAYWLLCGRPKIEWVSRDDNPAGWYIEDKYGL